MQSSLPKELERVREIARRVITPIKPYDKSTEPIQFDMKRTKAGRALPPYYLVYFLLVELLDFRHSGHDEKVAWSVPIDFNGVGYVIEHRKMGLGVFAKNPDSEEIAAQEITDLINKGVKVAKPFYKWMAEKAVRESKINVKNKGGWLFDRYIYWRDESIAALASAKESRKRFSERDFSNSFQEENVSWVDLNKRARWIAIEAIDSFFSWTEHIFIHIAVLQGKITTGDKVAELADAEWVSKFKCIFDLGDPEAKSHYDKLVTVRRQFRNYMAHGAFGKSGEAFLFHSGAGAVPVAIDHRPGEGPFSFSGEPAIDDEVALRLIDEFITFLWSGPLEPARLYIQECELPLILPFASDGTYKSAMKSTDEMREFLDGLTRAFDIAGDMDW